jgi:hypothetical protein
MGEIRVQVKLTNAVDEALAHRGDLSAEQVRSCDASAMVDTGAIRSVLTQELVDELGSKFVGNSPHNSQTEARARSVSRDQCYLKSKAVRHWKKLW